MVAIRPPEYFPNLAYCALMLAAETLVVADTFSFSRQSWHNRTKIRTPGDPGWQWLTVPRLHNGLGVSLNDLEIDYSEPWGRTHERAVKANYGMAPFYDWFAEDIRGLLARPWRSVGELTVASVRWLHDRIKAPSELIVASELQEQPSTLEEIRESLGMFTDLIALPDAADHNAAMLPEVHVHTFQFEEQTRTQNFPGFVEGMSTLDMLFNHGSP